MASENLDAKKKHFDLGNDQIWERPIIIAANRAPATFDKTLDGELSYSRGAGGLVSALTGLAQYFPTSWIACARTQADIEWGEGEVEVLGEGSIHVHFLNPDPEAYEGYYNVISNPLLWFLQHSMWDLPRAPLFNQYTWSAWEKGYQSINRLFANKIVNEVKKCTTRPLVMLQDYQLYLVGRSIKKQMRVRELPTLLHFIHIPWPGPEYWRILPPTMRESIIDSLCSMDLIGFQTKDDGLNFLRTVETYLPRAAVRYNRGHVWYRHHMTYVRDFPISIDVQALRQTAKSEEVEKYNLEISELAGECNLIVRIDRIDPSKNILRGFQAFEELLELHPEHRDCVKFLAMLIPSRLGVTEYQTYLDECMAAAGRVNAKYGNSQWEPIRLMVSENYPRAVAAMQSYDVLLVNAIADGMNLVAKEGPVVNKKDGVLILSERTGAKQQLEPGALIISPCDIYATAEAMHQALTMSHEERKENANRLQWLIEREEIGAWIYGQLKTINDLGL